MPFFDFHLHPTLKCMFSQDRSKTSPWSDIDPMVVPWFLRWCTDFQYILSSQADLRQLTEEKCNLVCVALYAPERSMTENQYLNRQASGSLSQLLDPDELSIINRATTSPFSLVQSDLTKVLLNPGRFGITDHKVIPLVKGVNYKPGDTQNLYVVFSVEGCHSISSTYDKAKVQVADVLMNLDALRASYPVISVNITHLEQYPFCNHAYGILFLNDDRFKPTGKEISQQGISLAKSCYERNILVDLKHMSLGARRFFIERVRPAPDFTAINQPLVCTHAGFTGIPYGDIPDYCQPQNSDSSRGSISILWGKPKRYEYANTFTAFNPSSINLYDEDIAAILQSGGMIGLSMDKRILGYTTPNTPTDAMDDLVYEEEYISRQEEGYFFSRREAGGKMDASHCITNQEVHEGGSVNPMVAEYHLAHFMSHVLHIVYVRAKLGMIRCVL